MEDKIIKKVEGWQMIVDIYEDYVIKRPKNKEQMRKKIQEHLASKKKLHLLDERIDKLQSDIYNSIKIIQSSNIPKSFLANAIIKKKFIKQEKVILLKEKIDELSINGNIVKTKEIIDKLINFIIELWKYKIHENTYKFYSGYGVNKKEEIVLIDFLEITNNKEKVKKQIINKKWNKPRRYFNKVEKDTADYFIYLANKKLTLANFERNWGVK